MTNSLNEVTYFRIERNTTGYKIKIEGSTSEDCSTEIVFPPDRRECTTITHHAAAKAETENCLSWIVSEISMSFKAAMQPNFTLLLFKYRGNLGRPFSHPKLSFFE